MVQAIRAATELWRDPTKMLDQWETLPSKRDRELKIAQWLHNEKLVADLGCGNGRLLELLTEDVEYLGYDQSPPMISQALERPRRGERVWRVYPQFMLVDIFNFSPDTRFGAVVLQDVAIHQDDPTEAVRRIMALWSADRYIFTLLVGSEREELSLSTVVGFREFAIFLQDTNLSRLYAESETGGDFRWFLMEVINERK